MSTVNRSATANDWECFVALVEALEESPRDVRPGRAARALVRLESSGHQLVGLLEGGARAVVYNNASRSLVALPFDDRGVSVAAEETLRSRLDAPGSWVDAYRTELSWVHPRYRRDAGSRRRSAPERSR